MTIFQQYYTSFQAPENSGKQSGFGVQAETPGMPVAQEKIKAITGYHHPSSMPIKAIDQHPIALRFQAVDGQGILTCVQSSGADELGRDGNYFAHTLVGRIEDITSVMPPIFYWKSDFWVSKDITHYANLPSLANMDMLPINFDSDVLWDFIGQGTRRTWLQKMLCAVIDFARSKRPIIILDTNESIAQWIACVTLAIPSAYHKSLSFATYHHDPNRAPFMLIGTTRDSSFRFSNDEYTRYFILNAEDERVSDAPPSDYADFVAQRFNRELPNQQFDDVFQLNVAGRKVESSKMGLPTRKARSSTLLQHDSPGGRHMKMRRGYRTGADWMPVIDDDFVFFQVENLVQVERIAHLIQAAGMDAGDALRRELVC